jgi:hypothetical protein
MFQLAQQTLGSGLRWQEIHDLNPSVNPMQPIPAGTVLRMPPNAKVD